MASTAKGPTGRTYDIAQRAQMVLLKQYTSKTNDEISAITNADPTTIKRFHKEAVARGFDRDGPLLVEHLENKKRAEVPSISKDPEVIRKIANYVSQTRATRGHNLVKIASRSKCGLKKEAVRKILKKQGFRKVKRTTKPGLDKRQRQARYQWALKFKGWTLEDWKRVCFSDETSIQVGHRRGGDRVWRKPSERDDKTCSKARWKGYSDFMFWGCFSYNFKGPCHIWEKETAKEKKESEKAIHLMNKQREPEARAAWEIETSLRRIRLNRPGKTPGIQPQWKYTKGRGFLARDPQGKGGIDWWRYRVNILLPKLVPFCLANNLILQQDLAPSHAAEVNQELLQEYGIEVLEWAGNSPDLNMIEPAWPWMKRGAGHYEGFESKKESPQIWRNLWDSLPQERIRRWIERLPRHIQKIIDIEGGNEYKEGAKDKQRRLDSQGKVIGEVVVDLEDSETGVLEASTFLSFQEVLDNIQEDDDIGSHFWSDMESSDEESD